MSRGQRRVLRLLAWVIEHPEGSVRILQGVAFAAWMTAAIRLDPSFWEGGLLAALFLSALGLGILVTVNHTIESTVDKASEDTDLHPDLLRMDLADYMRNYKKEPET